MSEPRSENVLPQRRTIREVPNTPSRIVSESLTIDAAVMAERVKRPTSGVRRLKVAAIAERDGTGCHWCGQQLATEPVIGPSGRKHYPPNMATIEHLTPISEGGGNGLDNLALACGDCNNRRHQADPSGRSGGSDE